MSNDYINQKNEIFRVRYEAAITAVHRVYRMLPRHEIENPPHHKFDAALARQIVCHVLAKRYSYSKRELIRNLDRQKEAISRALKTVDGRIYTDLEFSDTYDEIVADTEDFEKEARQQ